MRFLHVPGYIAWLVLQVLIAATAIIVDNLRPRQRQHPELVAMPLRVSSEAEIAWLSTSITMTPVNIGPIHIEGVQGMRMVVFSIILMVVVIVRKEGLLKES